MVLYERKSQIPITNDQKFMINYLTKEGLEKLKKELEELKTTKRKEISEKLKHAISFGDLKENAAYHEAKDSQAFLEGKIMELQKLINSAVIAKIGNKEKVQIGDTVTIESSDSEDKSRTFPPSVKPNGKVRDKYVIVSPAEADPIKGKISSESPLGKAILNLKAGEGFEFDSPGGKIKYKVLKIE